MDNRILIGRAEELTLPELGDVAVHARIDTGAKTSSIWASSVQRKGDILEVVFWGEGFPHYTGKIVTFDTFGETVVASSNGSVQHRYKVQLSTVLHGKRIRASYTLADRSTQAYPVLVGRSMLRNKFVVDVSTGNVPRNREQQRSKALKSLIPKEENKS